MAKTKNPTTKSAAPDVNADEVLFRVPLFAKFLENQKEESIGTNKKNDDIDTPKYPYDNSDITNVNPQMQVLGIQTTNKKSDTIYQTLKYPSDRDEWVTLKYPSDSDEQYSRSSETYDYAQESKVKAELNQLATQKYPSEEDDATEYPQEKSGLTRPSKDIVYQTMKYPSDSDEPTISWNTRSDINSKIPVVEKATQKYPSEEDDATEYPQDMNKYMLNGPIVHHANKPTKPVYDYVQTMKYPSDGEDITSKSADFLY